MMSDGEEMVQENSPLNKEIQQKSQGVDRKAIPRRQNEIFVNLFSKILSQRTWVNVLFYPNWFSLL